MRLFPPECLVYLIAALQTIEADVGKAALGALLSSQPPPAEAIVAGFGRGDLSAMALQPYEDTLRAGTEIWYEFICLYYKLQPLFTYFIHSDEYRHQVFRLLQGEVYDRSEVPVLDAMQEYVAAVEANPAHLLHDALDPSIDLGRFATAASS